MRAVARACAASTVGCVHRSEVTVDLGAVRRNVRTLLRVLDGAELWAVVKGDAYGHGAVDVAVSHDEIPEGVRVHLKLDTGMGRFGARELPEHGDNVVAATTHFATADTDEAFARTQLERFLAATAELGALTRHAANSAAALRLPEARL